MGNRLKKILVILKKTFGVFKKEKVAAFFAAVALTLKEKFTAFKESKFGHAVVSGLKAIGAKIAEYDDEEVIREKVDEITDKIFAAILAGPRYLLKKFKESKAGSAFLSGLKALQERVSARIACFSKDKVKEKAAAIFAAVLAALRKKHEAFKASRAGTALTAAWGALKKKFKESKAGAALISVWQPLKEKKVSDVLSAVSAFFANKWAAFKKSKVYAALSAGFESLKKRLGAHKGSKAGAAFASVFASLREKAGKQGKGLSRKPKKSAAFKTFKRTVLSIRDKSVSSVLQAGGCLLIAGVLVVQLVGYFAGQIVIIPEEEVPLTPGASMGYVYTAGDKFYDESGNLYQICSIGFGNAFEQNNKTPVYNYCTEDSYRELADLGFNTVRFYLNYGLLEDDSQPYVYKEEGFAWLDQNIEWASKYGIHILFNMHYPQGGYQSQWDGMDLWRNQSGEQQRLIALWKAIAQRYADNTTVLGYGLLNEPHLLLQGSASAALQQWTSLAQQITDAIRSVDLYHILFVESATGAQNPSTGETIYQLNNQYNLISVNDPVNNVAYEMHIYEPVDFTMMGLVDQTDDWVYPNPDREVRVGNDVTTLDPTFPEVLNENSSYTESGWTYEETVWLDTDTLGGDFMTAGMGCFDLNNASDCVYLDDLVIYARPIGGEEYVVYETDFSSAAEQWENYWNLSGSSSYGYTSSTGHNGNGCMMIQGVTSYSILVDNEPYYIHLREGYEYKIAAWVKVESSSSSNDIIVYPQMVAYESSTSGAFTIDYMNNILGSYKATASSLGRPLYIGEVGLLAITMNYGGDQWLSDFLSICNQKGISYSYHDYHAVNFGFYMNSAYSLPANRNEKLYQVFQNYVG